MEQAREIHWKETKHPLLYLIHMHYLFSLAKRVLRHIFCFSPLGYLSCVQFHGLNLFFNIRTESHFQYSRNTQNSLFKRMRIDVSTNRCQFGLFKAFGFATFLNDFANFQWDFIMFQFFSLTVKFCSIFGNNMLLIRSSTICIKGNNSTCYFDHFVVCFDTNMELEVHS